ncbi:hypothetical protein PQX77_009367 [Marasmius sp. AFHP31]|nr:hypothetical protein PQX77_009367 [Marasmius sp. AFHP31]
MSVILRQLRQMGSVDLRNPLEEVRRPTHQKDSRDDDDGSHDQTIGWGLASIFRNDTIPNSQNRVSTLGFASNISGPGGLQGQSPGNPLMNHGAPMFQPLPRIQDDYRQLGPMSLAHGQLNQNGSFTVNLLDRLESASTVLPHRSSTPFTGLFPDGLIPSTSLPHPPNLSPPGQPIQGKSTRDVQSGPPFRNLQPQKPGATHNGKQLVPLSKLQERQNATRSALSPRRPSASCLTSESVQSSDPGSETRVKRTQTRVNLPSITALVDQTTSQGRTHLTSLAYQPLDSTMVSGVQHRMHPPANSQPLAALGRMQASPSPFTGTWGESWRALQELIF